MTQATLTQILSQLETLELDELQQLNQMIQQHIASKKGEEQRAAFHQALLDAGLIKAIQYPSRQQKTARQLTQIHGQPLSETILEERR